MSLFSKILRALTVVVLGLSAYTAGAAQEKKRIAYGVLLDNTGSMRSQFDAVKEIGKAVARQIREHGPVSLVVFASGGIGPGVKAIPTIRVERSQDERQLIQAIDNLYVQPGQTTLLDAIELVSERLQDNSSDADRIIVLITDGEERSSEVKKRTLIQKLKDLKIKVFAVGLVQQLDSEGGFMRPSPRSKGSDLLKSLARETGGRAVFPRTTSSNLPELLTELAIPIQ